MSRQRTFKVDFFCLTYKNKRTHEEGKKAFISWAAANISPAIALDDKPEEKYQLRSVTQVGGSNIFKAVFGKLRFEKMTQGDEAGAEKDVNLDPGYGLVEKNHLLFDAGKNLLVWERHGQASHFSKFQKYINTVIPNKRFALESILLPESYEKLMNGGDLRSVELSIHRPKDAEFYENQLSKNAVRMVHDSAADSIKINIRAGRSSTPLASWMKGAIFDWAKSRDVKVAKARVIKFEEPIDLLADRLIITKVISTGNNGKAKSDDIFNALDAAKDEAATSLGKYFGDD